MANRVFHIAFLAALAAGCGEDKPLGFEAGPLGAVEVDAGAAVQVRFMLPLTGLQDSRVPVRAVKGQETRK